jgi:hypothetical protein
MGGMIEGDMVYCIHNVHTSSMAKQTGGKGEKYSENVVYIAAQEGKLHLPLCMFCMK